jgi:Mn2+/Fe2+ NRAMP family transporter
VSGLAGRPAPELSEIGPAGHVAGEPARRVRGWRAVLGTHPLARLGPGLITGVADDDPGGIATYSQAGAQLGLEMLWTMPVAYPMMAAVQSMCARIGRVTGKGLAANIREHFAPVDLKLLVLLLLVANTLNIAADVAAMGEVGELVSGVDRHVLTPVFVIGTLLLQILVPYHRYVVFLKWLTLSLLAYAGVLMIVHVPWGEVAVRTVRPHLAANAQTATAIVAIFGTTISPYLFFWQASEEVEDLRGAPPLISNGAAAGAELARIRFDTWSGMLLSNVAAYCIILATAVTLHANGVTRIDSAAQAASALQPLAGDFAFLLFALGIVGVGLIGVPVLAGSAGYAMCEAMGWKWGLERTARDARGVYGVIVVSVLAGLAIQYSPVSPMRALYWSAVINGLVAVPLLAVVTLLASRRSVMGAFTAGKPIVVLGWLTTGFMAAAGCAMFVAR